MKMLAVIKLPHFPLFTEQ